MAVGRFFRPWLPDGVTFIVPRGHDHQRDGPEFDAGVMMPMIRSPHTAIVAEPLMLLRLGSPKRPSGSTGLAFPPNVQSPAVHQPIGFGPFSGSGTSLASHAIPSTLSELAIPLD
jgi:hypothetical protein